MREVSGSDFKPCRERRDCCGLELLGMTAVTEVGLVGREHLVEPVVYQVVNS